MSILLIVKFLTCCALIAIFPTGCESQNCSLSEKLKCDGDYQQKATGHVFSCSAAEDYLNCLDKVHTACESYPNVMNSNLVKNQAGTTIDEMENNRKRYGCIQVLVSGTGGPETGKLTFTVGLLLSLLIMKTTALL
ncbi:uncharacterized protein LOC134254365 [Saccostrea cucullata]|uniref:uncharacterized protein LOC134254365 n=1 Tax=Saccostrea cuccullata TaxID=36930 RepID=UPI002ED63926